MTEPTQPTPQANYSPDEWGPTFWRAIHIIADTYPENPSELDRSNYKAWFYALKDVLPCMKCRGHYSNYLDEEPLNEENLVSRDTLSSWVWSFHNAVNVRKGKFVVSQPRFNVIQANHFVEGGGYCIFVGSIILNIILAGVIAYGVADQLLSKKKKSK